MLKKVTLNISEQEKPSKRKIQGVKPQLQWLNYQPQNLPKYQKYSSDEIAKHNKPSDCWIILKGFVYDVTEYAAYHPGGTQLIYKYSGKDATSMFQKIHGYVSIDALLKKVLIGEVLK
eukprot:Anaeramoba_ignava/a365060_10.p1 GENE.a365060_10~~a365060_10.p1  ORF type:complete len:118 (-),score=33.35 a365060_10:38-391(-)